MKVDAAPVAADTPPVPAPGEVRPSVRCTLRVSPKGLYVDGDRMSRSDALAACKRTAGAVVVVEDSAPAAEWEALKSALHRDGVPILMRGTLDDNDCANDPLAKGCN